MRCKKMLSSILAFSLIFTQMGSNFVNVYAQETDVIETTDSISQEQTTNDDNQSINEKDAIVEDETVDEDEIINEVNQTDDQVKDEKDKADESEKIVEGSITVSDIKEIDIEGHIVYSYDQTSKNDENTRFNVTRPSYVVYPDKKVDATKAASLLNELGIGEHIDEYASVVFIVNPVNDTYDKSVDKDLYINFLNYYASLMNTNIKVIGIGSGATFVNEIVAMNSWAIAGIMTYGGTTSIKTPNNSIPAYVHSKSSDVVNFYVQANNASQTNDNGKLTTYENKSNSLEKVVVSHLSDQEEPLSKAFDNAWKNVFSKNYRMYNDQTEWYMAGLTKYTTPYELVSYVMYDELGITVKNRTAIISDDASKEHPNQWFEFLPSQMKSAKKGSIPLVVLLHGNNNDNRTQGETSGWIEKAAEEGFMCIAPEWQSKSIDADSIFYKYTGLGLEGIVKVIEKMLEEYPQLDASRLYCTGLSQGAYNTLQLGISYSDVFAAVEGSSVPLDFSNGKIISDAKNKQENQYVPAYILEGTTDIYQPIPVNTSNTSVYNFIRAYGILNDIDVSENLDLTLNKYFGIQLDNQSDDNYNGQAVYAGTLSNDLGEMIKAVAMEPYAHWNNKKLVDDIWDFMSQYAKDQNTGETLLVNKTVEIKGSYDKAINEVTFPKYESDGTKTDVHVSDLLKEHLNKKDLKAIKSIKDKTLTVDVQLKDLYLNSEYLNGKSEAGISFYNMVNYFTDVKQIKQLLDINNDYTVIDSNGNEVDSSYINELLGLLNQIMNFDPTTNLKYDMNAVYDSTVFNENDKLGGTDVIATSKEGNVTFEFHIDAHGWWGYDLGADDSITALVMGYNQDEIDADRAQHESPLTKLYANFFVIEMENKGSGKWYMLNNTDLENPMIYVSKDGKEAFMIDVDFYGENVINSVIKSVIGDKCESLKIFCTHNHSDHVNNLSKIAEDEYLKSITTIIWPENEPHTYLDGVDLVALFDNIQTIKDMDKIEVTGNTFQFIEIPNEHTPGGGQLADLTNKVIYSGDSLGAQVHLGGTTIAMSNADNWLAGAKKAAQYIKDNEIKYNIGGHTPYLNTADYASWMVTAIEYAKEQLAINSSWEYMLVIVEDGKVVTEDRLAEMFENGLSDREELKVASAGFINDLTDNDKPTTDNSSNNKDQNSNSTNINTTIDKINTKNPKTSDETMLAGYVLIALISLTTMSCIYSKKKKLSSK